MTTCNGEGVRRYKGKKRSDPEVNCCLGRTVYLRRAGCKFAAVTGDEHDGNKKQTETKKRRGSS
jgi:hypothetical protein